MNASTYSIDDAHGTALCQGLPEHTARETAQRMADKSGLPVYLYEAGSNVEPIEVAPSTDDSGDEPIEYRAYDTTTEWSGPVRSTIEAAEADADRHNRGCAKQGGYGSAIVVTRDPDSETRLVDLDGASVWPPHGRSTGAARWR